MSESTHNSELIQRKALLTPTDNEAQKSDSKQNTQSSPSPQETAPLSPSRPITKPAHTPTEQDQNGNENVEYEEEKWAVIKLFVIVIFFILGYEVFSYFTKYRPLSDDAIIANYLGSHSACPPGIRCDY
jgi:hypothetical protein